MVSKTIIALLTSWIINETEFNMKIDPPNFFVLNKEQLQQLILLQLLLR